MLIQRRLMREQRVPDVVVLVVVLVPGAAAALHELHEQFPVAHLLVLLLPRGLSALAFLSLRCMASAPSSSTSTKADVREECD
jgi:hypothetical protein